MISQFIQKLRTNKGLSQEAIAQQIGVSRPTYAQIEQGEHDLTVEEARKLADIFELSLEDFLAERMPNITINVTNETDFVKEKNSNIRINVPQKNLKKFKEI